MFLAFVVRGIPISLQARPSRKRAWVRRVQAGARAGLRPGTLPLLVPAKLRIVYFHSGTPLGDIDNKIKLIADALVGIAYDDDSRVTDVRAVMQDQNATYRLPRLTPVLATALASGIMDFVYVEVDPWDPLEPLI